MPDKTKGSARGVEADVELTNEFTVDVPIDEAWTVLTDLERIAPCMPGARLDETEGDEYHGTVKVKVGPVTAEYRGKATFVERDEAGHRAVLRAEGREARGQGNASATITAQLEPVGTATRVSVTTDLTITGRVAQFGRGVLADVSTKLLGQFVDSLETTVLSGQSAAPAGAATSAEASGSEGTTADGSAPASGAGAAGGDRTKTGGGERGAVPPPAEASVDLVRVVGPALAKRVVPVLGVIVLLWIAWRLRSRR
ncbi:MAG: SRPBCC family protein [Acidimicrobiales bacterium]